MFLFYSLSQASKEETLHLYEGLEVVVKDWLSGVKVCLLFKVNIDIMLNLCWVGVYYLAYSSLIKARLQWL